MKCSPWAAPRRIFPKICSGILAGFLVVILTAFLAGCASEHTNPLAVEALGGAPPNEEGFAMALDGRGFVNGNFLPDVGFIPKPSTYPVSYSGKWNVVQTSKREQLFTMMSSEVGATVKVTATASRIVFEFHDFDFYQDAGTVEFSLDGAPLGTFDLERRQGKQKILDYVVTTDKKSVATVTMKLVKGRAVITGYFLIFHELPR